MLFAIVLLTVVGVQSVCPSNDTECCDPSCLHGGCLSHLGSMDEVRQQQLALKLYPGLFTDLCTARILLSKLEYLDSVAVGRRRRGAQNQNCCTTKRQMMYPPNITDVFNRVQDLYHLTELDPPMYQVIYTGYCGTQEGTSCPCGSGCVTGTNIQTVLVHNSVVNPPYSFTKVNVNEFCMCNP